MIYDSHQRMLRLDHKNVAISGQTLIDQTHFKKSYEDKYAILKCTTASSNVSIRLGKKAEK